MKVRPLRRVYLAAEYAALFFGGTTLYRAVARGRSPIPALLVLASLWWLRGYALDEREVDLVDA